MENEVKDKVVDEETVVPETVSKEDYDKLKLQFDKLASEIASRKKKEKEEAKAKMSEEEKRALEIQEKDNTISSLQRQLKSAEIKAKLKGTGYSDEQVEQLTEAFLNGDSEAFLNTISVATNDINTSHKKAIEEAKLQGFTTPKGAVGHKTDSAVVTQDDFNNLSYAEKLDFKAKFPDDYKKFIKH